VDLVVVASEAAVLQGDGDSKVRGLIFEVRRMKNSSARSNSNSKNTLF